MIHEEGYVTNNLLSFHVLYMYRFIDEEIPVNEQSLMAEFGGMDTFAFTGRETM